MVTASHNPAGDNGVKLADPDGGMLSGDWEGWAVQLVNAGGAEEVLDVVRRMEEVVASSSSSSSIGNSSNANSSARRRRMVVHVGHDTRPHSPALAELALSAARAMGAATVDHGTVTTPQLHHCVVHANAHRLPNVVPARPNEGGYMDIMSRSYMALVGTKAEVEEEEEVEEQGGGGNGSGGSGQREERILTVDGACGVGHGKIQALADMLQKLNAGATDSNGNGNGSGGGGGSNGNGGMATLRPINGPQDGPLNDGCGAEHVQKNRLPPLVYCSNGGGGGGGSGQSQQGRHVPMTYAASLDGDADRVVFHYNRRRGGGDGGDDTAQTFRLLDGDKIAVLVTQFIREELRALQSVGLATDLRCGIVQTAYANGAATAYVRNAVRADVVVAKTGVKYVHAAAHHHFDVGVYFEANGHGTVLFSPQFYRMLDASEGQLRGRYGHRANVALQRLRLLPSLVNQSVGDAISDLLLVDAILYLKGWTVEDWDGLYEDLPSRQCKVKVLDRSVIRTNDSETKATAPSNLQPALDAAMAASDAALRKGGDQEQAPSRCFVRPSGTENAVRVYAEASTQDAADALASEAAALLHRLCGGVGDPPRPIVRSRM